jgi:hypothetical protein
MYRQETLDVLPSLKTALPYRQTIVSIRIPLVGDKWTRRQGLLTQELPVSHDAVANATHQAWVSHTKQRRKQPVFAAYQHMRAPFPPARF